MSNTLAVDVGKEKVRFLVNGTEVTSGRCVEGRHGRHAGLRVNHNLNLHVKDSRQDAVASSLTAEPLKADSVLVWLKP
jgi:hypothetical protein